MPIRLIPRCSRLEHAYFKPAEKRSCGITKESASGLRLPVIPATEHAPVLRADFPDERLWQLVCRAIEAPVGDFRASVTFVSDPAFEGITVEEVVERAKQDASFVFIVDGLTMSHQEHPLLVVDLLDVPGRTFRVIPSEMWGVENYLSLANMDFEEFAENTDGDGIFRGFQD